MATLKIKLKWHCLQALCTIRLKKRTGILAYSPASAALILAKHRLSLETYSPALSTEIPILNTTWATSTSCHQEQASCFFSSRPSSPTCFWLCSTTPCPEPLFVWRKTSWLSSVELLESDLAKKNIKCSFARGVNLQLTLWPEWMSGNRMMEQRRGKGRGRPSLFVSILVLLGQGILASKQLQLWSTLPGHQAQPPYHLKYINLCLCASWPPNDNFASPEDPLFSQLETTLFREKNKQQKFSAPPAAKLHRLHYCAVI